LIGSLANNERPLHPEQLQALCQLGRVHAGNAIETFNERLRNEGFVDHTVRALFPQLKPMLGYSATIKIRGSAPPTARGTYPDRTDWWEYILSLPEPRVVVVQDVAHGRDSVPWVGAVHMNLCGTALRWSCHQWVSA